MSDQAYRQVLKSRGKEITGVEGRKKADEDNQVGLPRWMADKNEESEQPGKTVAGSGS